MNIFDKLSELTPVIFPEFYTVTDKSGNEFVLLKDGELIDNLEKTIDDKTAFEAFINHFHIFDKIPKDKTEEAFVFGKKTAENFYGILKRLYPDKKFYVYLIFNPKESTIVRFHQAWDGEYPYHFPSDDVFIISE